MEKEYKHAFNVVKPFLVSAAKLFEVYFVGFSWTISTTSTFMFSKRFQFFLFSKRKKIKKVHKKNL